MNNNENMLNDLSALSDAKLQALIKDIGTAVGASPRKTDALSGDLSKVRKTISSMKEDEAKRLIDRAGKEKSEQIYQAIKRSKQ